MTIISPSILSADFANLQRDIELVENAGANWLHIDVMDGHFVPNITIGVPVVASIKKITKLPLDVHLMIDNPDKYIDAFAKAGADIITFHIESINKFNNSDTTSQPLNLSTPQQKIIDIKRYAHFIDFGSEVSCYNLSPKQVIKFFDVTPTDPSKKLLISEKLYGTNTFLFVDAIQLY